MKNTTEPHGRMVSESTARLKSDRKRLAREINMRESPSNEFASLFIFSHSFALDWNVTFKLREKECLPKDRQCSDVLHV